MAKAAAIWVLVITACGATEQPKSDCVLPPVIGFGGMLDLPKAPPAVAVGGTIDVVAKCATTGNEPIAIDFPYEVAITGGDAVGAQLAAPVTELEGLADGNAMLEVRAGDHVYATFPVSAHVADAIAIVPSEGVYPGPWEWAPGAHHFTLAVTSGGEPVADRGTTATFPGLVASDFDFAIDVAQDGTYSLAAHAGTLDTPIAFAVSDVADAIAAPDAPAQIHYPSSGIVCFEAIDHGRAILGLTWTFTVAGAPVDGYGECVNVNAPASSVGHTVDVTGSATGQSLTLTLPVM